MAKRTPLPFEIIQVGSVHGLYLAYDYGCGDFATATAATPLEIISRFWVGNNVTTTIANGEEFRLPGIMIEAYKGDEDDGSNRFRAWFWKYEITPTLTNNADEPLIEICYNATEDGKPDYLINAVKTENFAAMGVGLFKTDAWYAGSRGEAGGPGPPQERRIGCRLSCSRTEAGPLLFGCGRRRYPEGAVREVPFRLLQGGRQCPLTRQIIIPWRRLIRRSTTWRHWESATRTAAGEETCVRWIYADA